jgi:hypothetical protein
MKKIILFTLSLIVCSAAFAQFGYKHKLDTVNGVEISYKIVHAKHFDKESSAQLRIKLKNLNSHDVNVKFSIEYSIDFTKKYNSGGVEICIAAGTSKAGTISGLAFELNTNDIKIFEGENAEWEFIRFDVEQIDDCKVLND